jgi:predicted DCC family thiol-disulfide oxidoreductase YuxK
MPAPRIVSQDDLAAVGLASADTPLIVFDGVCHLCTGFVRFVLRHDRAARFHFLSAQSARGAALYGRLGMATCDWESNLLVADGRVFTELDAFIEITRRFGGAWRLMPALYALPRRMRDALYLLIARNRYRWFGRRETCWLPEPAWSARFLN